MRLTNVNLLASFAMLMQVTCAGSQSPTTTAEFVVADTLGTQFSVSCTVSFCTLTPKDSSLSARSCDLGNGPTDAFVLVWNRIMRIHALRMPEDGNLQFSSADPGHPVVCTSDSDCQITSYTFSCLEGLCQRTDTSLTTDDVIALCQADIAWPTSCPYISSQPFASRMVEVAASCGSKSECATVPADCRQPAAVAPADGGAPPSTPAEGVDAGP
jgi:hypothetical protein